MPAVAGLESFLMVCTRFTSSLVVECLVESTTVDSVVAIMSSRSLKRGTLEFVYLKDLGAQQI